MVDDEITNERYAPKKFQYVSRCRFKDKFVHFRDMRSVGWLYATQSKMSTYTYNAAKVIANYLKLLCQRECKIHNTQPYPPMLKK